MKRTNIVLDERLVQDCIKATGIKTQKELIDHALRELLRHENRDPIESSIQADVQPFPFLLISRLIFFDL